MNVSTQSARAVATPRTPARTLARWAGAALASLALLCLPGAAEAQTLTIGQSAAGEAAQTVAPGSNKVLLDTFTLTASAGTAVVTSLTVVLPVGSSGLLEQVTIESGPACSMPSPLGTVLNPATDTVAVGIAGLSVVSPAAVTYYVCLKPRAATAMPAVPGSSQAVTGRVSAGVAAGFTVSSTDAVGPAVTIDNLSPGAVTAADGTPGDHQVGLRWTNPVVADFKEALVIYGTGPIPAGDVPVEGRSYDLFTLNQGTGSYEPTLIGTSRVGYVGAASAYAVGGSSDPATWLTNGTPYYFKIYARDFNGNYSAVGATAGPFTPVALSVTTIGPGTESAAASLAPGGAITNLDAFTLVTAGANDTVTAATVSLSPSNAFANVGLVQITSNDGLTVYASRTDPASSTISFTGLTIPVLPLTPVQFRIRIQPKSHAAMPAVPGASYGVTGLLTAFTSTKPRAGSDTGSSTVTIDNLSPNDSTWGTVSPGNGSVTLNWTNATVASPDFLRVAIVRSGAPVTAVPVEGDLGPTPALTGSGTVAYVGAGTTTVVGSLTNGTPYYFKIFAQDASGNWAAGVGVGPLIPGSGGSAVGSTVPNTTVPVVQVVNPSAGAKLATTFRVQVRAWSPTSAISNVTVRVNLGSSGSSVLAKNAKYPGGTTAGVWEGNLTLPAGTYTLDAQATNGDGTVASNSFQVTVAATRGDGNLLVRDNAAQLCTDCHNLPTHSSQSTGSTYGSWSSNCRDCHTPHSTHNVFLVGESITPPPRGAGTTAARTVAFSNTSGTPGNMALRTTASYVNTDNTGPCQVCHTLTLYYRADGTSPGGAGHQTGQRCTQCHQHTSGMAVNCTGCHGTPGRTGTVANTDPRLPAAPPRDTAGLTVTTSPGVGAHLAHLDQTSLRANPLACSDCHPASNAHQGTTDFGWSALANGGLASVPLTPSYAGGSCSATWCHTAGGTYGGTTLAPAWTGGPSQVAGCATCHGSPPPAPHPANAACTACHPGYATTGLNAAARITHIDGTLQVPPPGACTSCHGTASRTPVAGLLGTDPNIAVAPPMDTTGSTAADAHMAHVNLRSAPVQCIDCHGILPAVGDPSHPNATLDVTMAASALANQGGSFAVYAAGTCSSVYCHGATLPDLAKGSSQTPAWNSVVGCGTCHGAPPGDPLHKSAGGVTTCNKCHNETVNTSGGIIVNLGMHVNGTVESNIITLGCSGCHGTPSRANASGIAATFFESAPPTTITGATTGVGAGVHVVHVNGTRSKNVECEVCHGGSTAFENASPNYGTMWTHADGIVDLRFTSLAIQGGAVASYTLGSGAGCAATYCHGNFTGGAGAANVTPAWTAAGTLGCTSCHGNPPALPHPQNDACGGCHGTGYAKTGATTGTVIQVAHIDGATTGQSFGCTSCHGVINSGSPGAAPGDPFAAPGVGGGVAVTTAAAPSVAVPQYGAHSSHLTQSNFTGAAIACGECHQVPAVNDTTHGSGGGTGGAAATMSWSALATGNVAAKITPVTQTSAKGGSGSSPAPASAAAAGPGGGSTTDAWSTPAVPSYNRATGCTATYCHGEFRNGQLGKTIVWAQDTVLNCNSCHGTPGANPATPPTGTHPISTNCSACHPGYTGTTVNVAIHLNGKLEYSGTGTCDSCHGEPSRTSMVAGTFGLPQSANNLLAMPPRDSFGQTVGVKVGGHPSHAVPASGASQVFKPVQCSECHGIGVNSYGAGHSNSVTELTFANATSANLGGVTPSIVQGAGTTPDTCTTYCHGASLSAQQRGSVSVWQWTTTASATCGSCHGSAPNDAAHTTVSKSAPATACNPCHSSVVNGAGGIVFNGTGTSATTLHINGTRQNTATCRSCHGNATNFAPPLATSGSTATSNPKVGAHQKHLTGTTLRTGALACDNCHAVPSVTNHATGTVNVAWNTLATASAVTPAPATGAVAPAWETAPTCTNYCHGGKWAANPAYRGATTSVSWTGTVADAQCNDCHQAPPASGGHASVTTATNCNSCHGGYTCTSGNLAGCVVNKSVHINGFLDAPNMTCSTCHGTAGRTPIAGTFGPAHSTNNLIGMAPIDTAGASAGVKVGGHVSHATPTPSSQVIRAVACSECHGTAVNSYTTSHPNSVSDVTFANATLANLGGVTPSIVQGTGTTPDTCTTYCHGASLTTAQKGAITTWTWTTATSATCGSCHGSAPNDPVHTSVSKSAAATACNPCHNTTVNTSGGIIFNGTGTSATTLHINGLRQATTTCRSCHGGAVNFAPPVATSGSTATTNPKVGAHQKHVTATNLRTGALTCTDCHAVPTGMNHATGAVNVAWNTLAQASAVTPAPATGVVAPAWETAPTCTNYCHGGKWAANASYRGATTSVSWIGTPADAQCNDCHLAPPNNGNHGTVLGSTTKNCGDCHLGYACTTGNLVGCTVNKTVHLNGTFEAASLSCTSCHGTNGVNGAPPIATNGASSGVKVGAHQKHLTGTTLRTGALACDNCHTLPGSTTHSDAAVGVTWNTLATTSAVVPAPAAGTVAPAWETAPTCTNYCHGGKWAANPSYRGATTSVSWTGTVADAQCNDCHQAPPVSGGHGSVTTGTSCSTCHTGYACTSGNLAGCTVNKSVHINGVLNVVNMTCSTCHGTAGRTPIAGTFGPAHSTNNLIGMAPIDTAGASAGVKVGGHVSHATPTPSSQVIRAVACSECHGTAVNSYTTAHPNSVSDVTFANATLANLGGVTPSIVQGTGTTPDTCTTYCHGASLTTAQKGAITTWTWTTATSATCGSCHGSAPNDPVHTSVSKSAAATACNPCHNTTVNTSGGIIFNGTGTSATTLHVNGLRQATTTCRSCHGNATNFAPPVATSGTTATTNPKVGAHQKHLTGTTLRTGALACDNCHAAVTLQNHATGAVNVAWNTLAIASAVVPAPAAGTVAPAWETAPTCTNYCHGGKWAANASYRGATTSVSWIGTPADAQCNDCHQAPPASGGHGGVGTATNCSSCHTGYACTSGNLAGCTVNKTIHLNGFADLPVMTCASCHGTAGRTPIAGTFGPAHSTNNLIGMAPIDTAAASTGVKVGGHVSHATPTPSSQVIRAVACSECHGTAVNSYTTAHPNSVSDVTFANATLANLGGVTPSIVQGAGTTPDTCTTYCHGASLTAAQKGAITTWTWTTATSANCGSCHGSAPNDAVHTSVSKSAAATACNPCHNTTVNTSGGIIFNGTGTSATTLHVNGLRQATTTCRSCHGNATNFAPPTATNGTTATTAPKVGAHQKHLTGTTLRTGALACDNCHAAVTLQNHATGAVNVAWNTLAIASAVVPAPAAGTVAPAWETAPTCTNYCHGGKWAANASYRGATTSVSWIGTPADAQCNDCHQAPPASGGHGGVGTATNCNSCHTGYACTSGNLAGCTVNKTIHLNGFADLPVMTCASCHGTAGRTPIAGTFGPAHSTNNLIGMAPIDTAAASTGVKVGGHVSHATPTPSSQVIRAVACSECHGTAVNSYTTAHPNSVSDVTFANATLANLGGVTPSIVQGAGTTPDTCTTYCHGASLTAAQKGAITTWTWTTATSANCGSCHGSAPNDAVHTSVSKSAAATACNPCHNTTVNTSGGIIFNGTGTSATTLHVNGLRQATTTCRSCHGNATNFAPPVATSGTTATTNPKVGAHQKHLTGTTLRTGALACDNCHALPAAQNHATGAINVAWNTLASLGFTPTPAAGTVAPAWETAPTCTNYCHGGKWAADATKRGATTSVSWTGTVADAQCNDCHQTAPTNASHSAVTSSTNCSTCHSGYNCTSGNLAGCTVNKTIHLNGVPDSSGTCTGCHNQAQGTRRNVVAEFSLAWSHKRSATPAGTVTKFDCVVCHMEGDLVTGDPVASFHPMTANGNINLRDPDTGVEILNVTYTNGTGASAGSYANGAGSPVFTDFSRNMGSTTLEAPVQAVMINLCLKCHDSNGAQAAWVRGPTAGSSAKPFNTTIAGATYTGIMTAGGVLGGVTDVKTSFATTNSSYHPILGQQNNSYVSGLRMNAPWTTITKTGGNTTTWGYRLSCWDCHAPQGATGVQTATVTAHGGAVTLRQTYWAVNATNLCTTCHRVVPVTGSSTSTHGQGSAWSTTGNGTPGGIARTSCFRCHGSNNAAARPPRPYAAQDVHGFNAFSPATGTDTLWPVGATNTYRPYGFMRSAGTSGLWNGTISWKPLSGPGVGTGNATCGSGTLNGCSNQNHGTYTPGGVY